MNQIVIFSALLCAVTSIAHAETVEKLDEVVVTATRFTSPSHHSPVNVKVITASDIEKSAAQSLPGLLAQHAGIHVRSSDGTGDMAIDLRGFGMAGNQNTLVLLDGQRLNDIELTSIRWSAIPLASIERIEIINGGGSVLYGGGASGGTINIITKRPRKELRGTASAGLGSYAAKEWQVALAGSGERVGMHVTASGLNSDNYRVNNSLKQSNVEADVRTEMGQGEAIFKLGGDKQNLRFPGSRTVDPTTGVNQLLSDPQGTSTPLDYGIREGSHLGVGTTQQLTFGEFAAELAYRNKKQQAYYDAYGGKYLDTALNVISFSPRVKLPVQLGKKDNELIVGFDFADWDYDSRRSSSPATIGTPTTQLLSKQLNRGVYAYNKTNLDDDTQLTLGARSQVVDYQARDAKNSASYAAGSQAKTVNAYELGLSHNLNRELSLFARVGRSFRLATVDESFDQYGGTSYDSKITMLEPQTSVDSELGVDYKSLLSKLRATLFQMNLDNEIHYNALTYSNMNLSPTTRYGLELEGTHSYAERVEVAAAYTYTVAKFREGTYGGVNVAGNNIPLVPKQRLVLSSSWKVAEKTVLNGSANYVGAQHFDNDQANTFSAKVPAYTTVDVKLTHRNGVWLLAASANNILNEKYFTYGVASTSTAGKYNAYPMRDRNFAINATYEF